MKRPQILAALLGIGFFLTIPVFLKGDTEGERKFAFELSLGVTGINPDQLYQRAAGINTLVGQYAALFSASVTESGKFTENKFLFPLQALVRYHLAPRWVLKGGMEYGFCGALSQKGFVISQTGQSGATETQTFETDYRISYLLPQVGAAYRASDRFEVYGMAGLALVDLTYTEGFLSKIPGLDDSESTWTYEVGGTAPALLAGLLYRLPLQSQAPDKLALFIKLEFVMMKVGSLTGSRKVAFGSAAETVDGTLYAYGWNPYGRGAFNTWELYTEEPPVEARDAEKLALNLSGLRLLVGISF
jgi:hypothetical protein